MQEQAPYKITPEQGWSKMKSVLDREMPVEKRSRRMIVFWWSVAGIVLIGLIGAFVLRSEFTSVNSNTTFPVQQVTPKQTEPTNETQPEQKAADSNKEFTMNAPKQEATDSRTEFANNNSSAEKDNTSISSKVTRTSKTIPSTTSVSGSNLTSLSADQNALTENNIHTTSADQGAVLTLNESISENESDANSINSDMRSNDVTESIGSLGIGYFTIPENELGPIQASEFTNIEKHGVVIRPGIEASVLSGFNGGTGVYAGAGADVKLSTKFSLTAGLGYRTFHPGANLFSATNADLAGAPANNELVKNDTIFDGFYVPGEAINNASYQDLDPVIESLHQWQAQAGVDWRFSRRFSLEGGLGLAFLTKAYSEYPIVPFSYATANSNTKISNSLEGYDVIRKTMASCFAGVSYHIGRHIAMKLQWLHTFQPYLTTNGNTGVSVSSQKRDDYIRGITLGMKYSFL